MKKKLNLITLMDFVFGTLAIHNIRVIIKLNGVTHQMESGKAW